MEENTSVRLEIRLSVEDGFEYTISKTLSLASVQDRNDLVQTMLSSLVSGDNLGDILMDLARSI